jgi:glutathione synthase/RimK-type ligase-like ATP-grasp enzyme
MPINKNKLRMWSYDFESDSGKLLADAMGILRIKHENSSFWGNGEHTVINWGASPKKWGVKGYGFKVLNHPMAVAQCTNKIKFFDLCTNSGKENAPNIPVWTQDFSTVKDWLKAGECVIARSLVEGMGGDGITIMYNPSDFVEAKLYTIYVPKNLEFRIYVVGGKMVDFAQKMKKNDETPTNWKIRSRSNGFIYVFADPSVLPDACVEEALRAVNYSGLDFGGVDVVYNNREKRAYVLEVNTAPWLKDSTAVKFGNALLEAIG